MFRRLADLIFGPDYLTRLNNALRESHEERLREQAEKQRREEQDPQRVRYEKKKRLEEELEDAKWILDYERKLTKIQAEVEGEVERTGDRGRSPKRLQNLQSHLCDVRRSITHE